MDKTVDPAWFNSSVKISSDLLGSVRYRQRYRGAARRLGPVQECVLSPAPVSGSRRGQHIGTRALPYPSVCGLRCGAGGPVSEHCRGLGCALEWWSLSISFEEKCGLSDAFPPHTLFFPLCLLFSLAVCSKEAKKVNEAQRLQHPFKHGGGSMQDSKCQACCFTIIQLREQQTKKRQLYFWAARKS